MRLPTSSTLITYLPVEQANRDMIEAPSPDGDGAGTTITAVASGMKHRINALFRPCYGFPHLMGTVVPSDMAPRNSALVID